jgi:hypothetical protein
VLYRRKTRKNLLEKFHENKKPRSFEVNRLYCPIQDLNCQEAGSKSGKTSLNITTAGFPLETLS